MSDKGIKILFFGDLVGRAARRAVCSFLKNINEDDKPDFVIANVENASHGFGLSEKNYNELSQCGIDAMTSGNHIWDKKDIFNYIETASKLIRPLNYPKDTQGVGYRIFDTANGCKIGVVSLLGRVFMSPVDSPWEALRDVIVEIKKVTPIVVVDFHAEATAEKICFGRFASELGVSAFFGTHTHVQTADEKIINNMSYITDAGFCGGKDSVIGMAYETSYKRLSSGLPERYEVADNDCVQIDTVEVIINPDTGYATDIKRFCSIDNIIEEKEGCCDNIDTDYEAR